MNEDQFKALMADNETLIKYAEETLQTTNNALFILLLGLSLVFLFTALKLEDIVSWNWLWVLSPGWLLLIAAFIFDPIRYYFWRDRQDRLLSKRAELINKLTKEK